MLPVDYIVLGVIAVCAVVVLTRFSPRIMRYIALGAVFLSACFSLLGVVMIHRLAWDQPKAQHFGPDDPQHRYFADGAQAAHRAAWRFIPGLFFSSLVLTAAALQGVPRRET
jgi:hypothetical protein